MSRMLTSHTNRPPIRAIGWATLALLAPALAAGASALGDPGTAGPPTTPPAVRFAACTTAGPHLSLQRFLCYRAAANLANERNNLPRVKAWPDLG